MVSKWASYVLIGFLFGVGAFVASLAGEDYQSLVLLLSIIGLIFGVVGVLIMAKFLNK